MTKKILKILHTDIGKLLSGNIIVQFTTVLQAVIVSRILGPEGKGQFIEIILWPTIISGFSILGLYTGIAKLSARKTIYDHYNLAKTTLKATLIVGIAGTIISCILSPLLISCGQNYIVNLAVIFSSFVLINNVARGFNAIDHGRKDFTRYSITRSILNPIFFLLLLILFCIGKLELSSVIISLLFANFSVCLIRTILTIRSQKDKHQEYPLRKLFKYSFKFSISDLSEPIYTYFDKAVLALVLANYDLGIYTTAYSAASLINILSNVYGTKLFSDIAGGTSPSRINAMLRQNFILMSIFSLFLILAIPFLIPFIFGPDFSPAIIPAILLLLTCILQGQSYVVERSILAFGFPFAGAKAKGLSMLLLALLAIGCKCIEILDIYILILIVTVCQMIYFIYILFQMKQLCKINLEITLRKSDFENLYNSIIK